MMNEWILSSSLLIAAVLALRFALRGRISLRLQYALWAVVLIRLLLPVQLFTSNFGTGAMAREVDISAPVRQIYVSEERYDREYDEAYRHVVTRYEASSQNYDPIEAGQQAQALTERSLQLDLKQLLHRLWFAGMAVMGAVITSCNVHLILKLRCRRWRYPDTDSLLPVYVTEAVPTPCIFGVFRPAIYLTPDAAGDTQIREHVQAHELTHYRHLDHIWSVLRSVCLVLHWYNPLVWLAARISRADAELACDEGALILLGESHRADYGRTLIGLTCPVRAGSMFVTATTMTGSIRERIRLLMARPRNTLLALVALILVGTIVVGCTFAGAPETTEPTQTTEPTGHAPENDMSYHGQELPIPEDLTFSDLQNADGVLVFPGTEWGMTEAELLDALDIQEYGLLSGSRGLLLSHTTFCGYPATIAFSFDRYRSEDEWGLTGVRVQLQDEEASNAVYRILSQALGRYDFQTSGVAYSAWWSAAQLEELVFPDAYLLYQEQTEEYPANGGAASVIEWFGSSPQMPENAVCFSSGLGLARQIEAALGVQSQSFAYALPMEQAMAEYAGQDPRELSEKELNTFRAAFSTLLADGSVNPAACFLLPYYEDISEMDGSEFLAYFPTEEEGTEAEFELLKAKYPDFFEDYTWETLPSPIHRCPVGEIEAVVSRYANIHWEELNEGVHYLEETGCCYNYTSDFGLGGFYARSGFVYDGGAVVYSDFSALFFTETMGSYTIRAHLPLIVPEE